MSPAPSRSAPIPPAPVHRRPCEAADAYPCLLRQHPKSPATGGGATEKTADAVAESDTEPSPDIRCRQCGLAVTRIDWRIARGGGFRHTFANPHGIVFDIGCFGRADGCAPIGEASDEFSWFPGYRWRIGVCRSCQIHLGWRFSSAGSDLFFGLIIDRLVFPET